MIQGYPLHVANSDSYLVRGGPAIPMQYGQPYGQQIAGYGQPISAYGQPLAPRGPQMAAYATEYAYPVLAPQEAQMAASESEFAYPVLESRIGTVRVAGGGMRGYPVLQQQAQLTAPPQFNHMRKKGGTG